MERDQPGINIGNSVCIPQGLFERMCECYYGHGARHSAVSLQLEAALQHNPPPSYSIRHPLEAGVGGGDLGQAPAPEGVTAPVTPMGLVPVTDIAKETYQQGRTDGS